MPSSPIFTHAWTDDTARIGIPGLTKIVRMLHITDSHLVLLDHRDTVDQKSLRQIQDWFPKTDEIFQKTLAEAAHEQLDLVVFTGDMMHFPAKASVEAVKKEIDQIGVHTMYVAGNHDWYWDGSGKPHTDETRDESFSALEPLHHGESQFSCREICGIQFVTVDNSTYQVSQDQTERLRDTLATGKPTVVMFHIPLSIDTLRDQTCQTWNAPILMNDSLWQLESRRQWAAGDVNLPATIEFARLLIGSQNLVAVFAGHLHFAHADVISSNAMQYVTAPGFKAQRRLVEFHPVV